MQNTIFARAELAAVCQKYGPQLGSLPAGIDGAQLLWGISGVESSFAHNCTPRHEPAYDKGGTYATHAPMPILLSKYGSGAACSYGPWQVMLCNAPTGYTPGSFDSLELACKAAVSTLNLLLRHWKPATLAQVGDCYNAGHITPDPDYERKLAVAYAVPMPEVA